MYPPNADINVPIKNHLVLETFVGLPGNTSLDKIVLDASYWGKVEATITAISASAKPQEVLYNRSGRSFRNVSLPFLP